MRKAKFAGDFQVQLPHFLEPIKNLALAGGAGRLFGYRASASCGGIPCRHNLLDVAAPGLSPRPVQTACRLGGGG